MVGLTKGFQNWPNLHPKRKPITPAQQGVAAACSSEQFKTKSGKYKPLARRWHPYMSTESASRTASSLKSSVKHLQNPNVISLGGGIPLSDFIPFDEVILRPPSLESLKGGKKMSSTSKTTLHATKHDIADGTSVYDLSVALNYGQGCGSAQFMRWITEHTEMIHDPPYADWQCSMTIGNTSAFDMCLRMLTEPGDCVLADKYTFSTAIETAEPIGINFIGVEMDREGMLPESLDEILDKWDPAAHANARKPSVLYAIPTGQNPTGTTQSFRRRKAIYRVARKHDLIILEDDPYYFLQMDPYDSCSKGGSAAAETQSPDDFFKKLVPSYLSIDIDGRVIRMDSFSKVISPGARLGWITAPQQLVERYRHHTDVSTQSPAGLSQLAVFKLLDEHWGHAGYAEWLMHLREEYTMRRDFIVSACERYLPRSIVSWEPTEAGMFQWLKIDWKQHPDANGKSADLVEEEIWLESISAGALVGRGSWFRASTNEAHDEVFYRTTFAAAPLPKIDEAVKRFGDTIRKVFELKEEEES
ncbi:PLP-dependent transferase [Trichoderma cornu-damae]|uniref:aromatic-amino-acid transaminase n=1 Tax=Trichoderma cornu-damae TaxID=654480 RepID=A0A9P8QL19_9HYPO|nr:PLP-dependent transferase [Trichoderma cornu-damae]